MFDTRKITSPRLAGKDIPERRAVLLEKLLGSLEVPDLSKLLPDSRKQLEEISRMVKLDLEKLKPFNQLAKTMMEIPVMLDFMLSEPEAAIVNAALDLVISREGEITRGKALLGMADYYLHHQPEQVEAKGETQPFSVGSLSN